MATTSTGALSGATRTPTSSTGALSGAAKAAPTVAPTTAPTAAQVKQAESSQIATLTANNNAIIQAIKDAAAAKQITSSEAKQAIKEQTAAGNAQIAAAKKEVAAPGQQTISTQPVVAVKNPTISQIVDDKITKAIGIAKQYNIPTTVTDVGGGTKTGVSLDQLVSSVDRLDPTTGQIAKVPEVGYRGTAANTPTDVIVKNAVTLSGKNLTPEQLKAQGINVQQSKTDPNTFYSSTTGEFNFAGNNTYTVFKKNPDGTLTSVGSQEVKTPTPEEGGLLSGVTNLLPAAITAFAPELGLSAIEALGASAAASLASGAKPEDVIKNVIASVAAPQLPDALSSFTNAITDPTLKSVVSNAITQAGYATITGKDVGKYALAGAAGGAVTDVAKSLVSDPNTAKALGSVVVNQLTGAPTTPGSVLSGVVSASRGGTPEGAPVVEKGTSPAREQVAEAFSQPISPGVGTQLGDPLAAAGAIYSDPQAAKEEAQRGIELPRVGTTTPVPQTDEERSLPAVQVTAKPELDLLPVGTDITAPTKTPAATKDQKIIDLIKSTLKTPTPTTPTPTPSTSTTGGVTATGEDTSGTEDTGARTDAGTAVSTGATGGATAGTGIGVAGGISGVGGVTGTGGTGVGGTGAGTGGEGTGGTGTGGTGTGGEGTGTGGETFPTQEFPLTEPETTTDTTILPPGKTTTTTPTTVTSKVTQYLSPGEAALGQALRIGDPLAAYIGKKGKERKPVWNIESLKLKDELGG